MDSILRSYFSAQFASGGEAKLDVFAIAGLFADGPSLSPPQVRHHLRAIVTPHVFERGSEGGRTVEIRDRRAHRAHARSLGDSADSEC